MKKYSYEISRGLVKITEVNIEFIGEHLLAPHQQRVVEEKKALDENINKLSFWLSGTDCIYKQSNEETQRQNFQLATMRELSKVLGDRIENFDNPDESYYPN